MIPEFAGQSAAVALGGRVSEVTARNRGGRHKVVPLCDLMGGASAWVGYREDWAVQADRKSIAFLAGSFTVHIGRTGEIDKPQVMRIEWASPNSPSFTSGAGHPHWQIDALETVRTRAQQEVRVFPMNQQQTVDFSATPLAPPDLLRNFAVERMHLAIAAPWWREPAQPVAHLPATVDDLNRWILGCLAYVRQEVARC